MLDIATPTRMLPIKITTTSSMMVNPLGLRFMTAVFLRRVGAPGCVEPSSVPVARAIFMRVPCTAKDCCRHKFPLGARSGGSLRQLAGAPHVWLEGT